MALKGTIKDFGVSDIFQLIGQQQKTGILVMERGGDEIRIHFRNGTVVRAESLTRPKRMLLGQMLINGGIIADDQLEEALHIQSRTLQRLGAVLRDLGYADDETIGEVARLQLRETVYGLFLWESGTYAFEQTEVDPPIGGIAPIAAEQILIEGVRRVDEWPSFRENLPDHATVLEQAKPLPVASASYYGEELGGSERRVYDLLDGARPLREVIDRSCLGEFEASRATSTLLAGGYIRQARGESISAPATSGRGWLRRVSPKLVLGRAVVYAAVAASAVFLARSFDASWYGVAWGGTVRHTPTIAQTYLANKQMRGIRRALEVYRLTHGTYPPTLDALVEQGILRERDVRFPYASRYFYVLDGETYRLIAPIY